MHVVILIEFCLSDEFSELLHFLFLPRFLFRITAYDPISKNLNFWGRLCGFFFSVVIIVCDRLVWYATDVHGCL